MTINDPRLTQIAQNIVDQHKWLNSVVWKSLEVPDEADHRHDRVLLGIVESLLIEAHKIITMVASE